VIECLNGPLEILYQTTPVSTAISLSLSLYCSGPPVEPVPVLLPSPDGVPRLIRPLLQLREEQLSDINQQLFLFCFVFVLFLISSQFPFLISSQFPELNIFAVCEGFSRDYSLIQVFILPFILIIVMYIILYIIFFNLNEPLIHYDRHQFNLVFLQQLFLCNNILLKLFFSRGIALD